MSMENMVKVSEIPETEPFHKVIVDDYLTKKYTFKDSEIIGWLIFVNKPERYYIYRDVVHKEIIFEDEPIPAEELQRDAILNEMSLALRL